MADTITIRTAAPHDLSAVDALLARSYPRLLARDYPPSAMVTAVPIIARARPRLLASGTYYIAESETGAALGAGGWTANRGRPGRADIRHLVTDPDHLRRGIGAAVMRTILVEAGAAGIETFDCMATVTAVPFYRAMGFVTVAPATVTLAAGVEFAVVRMVGAL